MFVLLVFNAVLFQQANSKTIHVYVKEISSEVPKVPYDIWNGTRFLFGKDLFPDKLKDFNGLVLKATSFNFPPYTYQARLQVASHHFNIFKIKKNIFPPSVEVKYLIPAPDRGR